MDLMEVVRATLDFSTDTHVCSRSSPLSFPHLFVLSFPLFPSLSLSFPSSPLSLSLGYPIRGVRGAVSAAVNRGVTTTDVPLMLITVKGPLELVN